MKTCRRLVIAFVLSAMLAAPAAAAPPDASYNSARQFTLDGDWANAAANYRAYLAAAPRGEFADDSLYFLAVALRNQRDFAGAIAAVDRLVREFPRSPFTDDALLLKGKITEDDLQRPQEAAVAYRNLLGLTPTPIPNVASEARSRLGDLALREQQLAPAIQEYSKAKKEVMQAQRAAPAPAQMANVQAERADEKEAFAKDNYDLDGKPLSLYVEAEGLARVGRNEEAAGRLERLLKEYPRSLVADDALLLLGDCYGRLGEVAKARAAYDRLAAEFKNSPAHQRYLQRERKVAPYQKLMYY